MSLWSLFIRPITQNDWHYRPFQREHRISFWVPLDRLKKKKQRFGTMYELKLDKRNWLEILLPVDKEAEVAALARHFRLQEKKLKLWPSLEDYPPRAAFPFPSG